MIGLALTVCVALLQHGPTHAAAPAEAPAGAMDWTGRLLDPSKGPFAAGAKVYEENCATCHDSGAVRAPQRTVIQDMTPQAIHRALTEGAMRGQGAALTAQQKVDVAEFLANRKLAAETNTATKLCKGKQAVFDVNEPPVFAAWGVDPASTHAIPTATAGLDRKNVARLKLKWAFGFPDSMRVRSQPALAGGAILVGNHTGTVYALDRETGCLRWSFDAEAEVRTGIVVSPWRAGDKKAKPLVYFGDVVGNAYALEAFTGKLAWKVSVDAHPAAVVTAAPALHEGTLYVPVSSIEEATAAAPNYVCCSFRGSVLALDAATGAEKWRTWLVDKPTLQKKGSNGLPQWGPSGVAVWNTPAIDVKRRQLYVATGDNYSEPATELSDAILALDLATGKINWRYQATAGDAWNVACYIKSSGNCPEDEGPDYDFGAGTVLAKAKDGRELVLAGQKSGIAYGVDPDSGKLVWQTRVGRGGAGGGILFGIAAADGQVFVPVTDQPDGTESEFPLSPGIYALDVASGAPVWRAPSRNICAGRPQCAPGYSGAISATPELVLAGAEDGHLRIYDAANGGVIWETDTARAFTTVNGIAAHGGAIAGGAAPLAYKGKLIVASGYGFASKLPGNVLLVFDVK